MFFLILVLTFSFSKNIDALVLNQEKDYIYASGETIGIRLNTGVKVIGLYGVSKNNKTYKPWEKTNLKEGDIIISIDGKQVNSVSDVQNLLDNLNENEIPIEFVRNEQIIKSTIIPVLRDDKKMSLGILIRDSILGIGTLTYVIPEYGIYGALGHSIGTSFKDGNISEAYVTGIKKGTKDILGEKRADIDKNIIGDVVKSTNTGIHGNIEVEELDNLKKYKIGKMSDCKLGEATILVSLDGNNINEYDIQIVELVKQEKNDIKGIKIKVVDEKLISKTGGIVQGMSGSPIIQDDMIVGAVTHVVVGNPTYGYGIYLEWMLEDMEININ